MLWINFITDQNSEEHLRSCLQQANLNTKVSNVVMMYYILMYVITITSNSADYHTSVVIPTVCMFLQACFGGAGAHDLSGQVAGRINIPQRCHIHVLQINSIYYGEQSTSSQNFLGYYAGFKLCTFIFQHTPTHSDIDNSLGHNLIEGHVKA